MSVEKIALEALNKISLSRHWTGDLAKEALSEIEKHQKSEQTVHNLTAASLIVDTPPGGGA